MPSDPLSTRRQLELLRELQQLAAARSEAEARVAEDHAEAVRLANEQANDRLKAVETGFAQRRERFEQQLLAERDRLSNDYESQRDEAQQRYHGLRSEAEAARRGAKQEAQQRAQDEAWEILAVFDARKGQPAEREKEALGAIRRQRAELDQLKHDADAILRMRRFQTPEITPPATPTGEDSNETLIDDSRTRVEEVRSAAEKLLKLLPSRLFEPSKLIGLPVIAAIVAGGVAAIVGASLVSACVAVVGSAVGMAAMLWFGLRPHAKKAVEAHYREVIRRADVAAAAIDAAEATAKRRRREEAQALIDGRNADLARLGFEIEQKLGETKLRAMEQLGSAGEIFPAKLAELREQSRSALATIESRLKTGLAELSDLEKEELEAIETERQRRLDEAGQQRDQAWKTLTDAWLGGYADRQAEAAAMRQACDERFADRLQDGAPLGKASDPPAMAVEFGRATVNLAQIESGLSDDERLRPEDLIIELPALVTLDDQPSLVVTASGAGRKQAADLLQAMALRWLVGQPPGKVRLTVLDPAGLGEGFASLMHLADHDENLIAGRIWSESRDIDEQLLRLTTHLETVIQKYLRSEYATIHEYNAQAGEVAEPFQVLVVNGFPTNFSDAACRRLMNLATSGPRCGVYVMLAVDSDRKPPSDFHLNDLLETAVHVDWQPKQNGFAWRRPEFERLPLAVTAPPDDEAMVEIVRRAGEAAKAAIRVEVPFAAVAPGDDELWRSTCGDELRIPVGRAGANRLQEVRLGKGTSQHLLVAGKTGSGKSTFLHALVTSAALRYSPDELEFYLVDFKKGVEFKAYATHHLPHARVVAIESEREFGLSVLQRLDEELTRRGEKFREAGVQTLADYRAARPGEPTPRQLLVVDEFQELFVQDDRLAQDATLLLDRLVRQGRAFGVHVLLGTQTLAGAYSLARSTLGQIAVRVALACSEADAHLILSDERNQAARFLSRPGEAIYNDQNGMVSANEPFQVVWLPDNERAEWLAKINEQAAERPPSETVVFEGNAPADIASSPSFSPVAEPPLTPAAYLGAAVAIKPPTSAPFGRHGGANLLIVGSDERAATGMLASAAISLTTNAPTAGLLIADGSRPGEPLADTWRQLADALPNKTTLGDAASTVAAAAAEVARREQADDHAGPPLYVVLHHAGRFRDLRRSDDDFSFSIDKDKPPSPDKQLAAVLRDGPGLGVHVLVWCDSYNAANRLFDRATLREFALRVAMPMSAADSSNLIDTPAAAQLNQHRALLYNDETGASEKFRPYGPPDEAFYAIFPRS